MAFTNSLNRWKEANGSYPQKVVIIRDGVGDGQLEYTKQHEVQQFEAVLKDFNLETTLCFIVVQKRINTRLFSVVGRGKTWIKNTIIFFMIWQFSLLDKVENPPPGTVLDNTITRKYLADFFLVPQNVNQGTVNPTHYIVLHDTANIKPEIAQKLCYKLCHLYYNWPGTIRVPAPCQYAHKIAAMVGQSIKTTTKPELADRLWFL